MRHLLIIAVISALLSACSGLPDLLQDRGLELVESYVSEFNAHDDEIYIQEFDNSRAAEFLCDNIPFFECPDKELEKTYYFRWWTYRKHIKSTPEGYVITEFLPEVPWAGKYNVINCAGMHQFREGRWLADQNYLNDYAEYWCRERKAARKYSFPIAYSFLEFYKVHPDIEFIRKSYPALKEIYAGWEASHWDEEAGLFWQRDGYDGMEVSISGAMSRDATGYRATINSYMYADAQALAEMAELLGEQSDMKMYRAKAQVLECAVNEKLWDDSSRFYKVIPRHGDMQFSYARELHGYVPWLFGLPGESRSDAWAYLNDTLGFKAPYGPTTAERCAEGFRVNYSGHDCQWNGPSWPFATAQTLTAMAATLNRDGDSRYLDRKLYLETLRTYSASHRRLNEKGVSVCWIDENLDPFTGEWLARHLLMERGNRYNERGKDYNHSTFCDLVISGLIGVQPQKDGTVVIRPLVPEGEWDWFALWRIPCGGKELSVVYDRTGGHYGCRPGLSVYVNGKCVSHTDTYDVRIVL
jgi:hypothetical protein